MRKQKQFSLSQWQLNKLWMKIKTGVKIASKFRMSLRNCLTLYSFEACTSLKQQTLNYTRVFMIIDGSLDTMKSQPRN